MQRRSSRLAAAMLGLLGLAMQPPAHSAGESADRNAALVAEALALPEDSVTRVTRCNFGRLRPEGQVDAVDSCHLALLKDRLLILKLKDRKPARFDILVSMPYAEIDGLALFKDTPAQIQLHFHDEVYGVDVLGKLLFRDGKLLLEVFRDLKAAGLPLVEPVEWIQTMPNPGVPFSMKIG